jgi:NodT family efflux transporter outer membrane factor (OMF) lipoprotein
VIGQENISPAFQIELNLWELSIIPDMQYILRSHSLNRSLQLDKLPGCLRKKPDWGRCLCLACWMILAVSFTGCTSFRDYIHNGFKVGPNYCRPAAPVAQNWIDADDKRVRTECDDLSKWWTVFNDQALNNLICCAYRQNLTLREAGFRVLQARAQLGITTGQIFPQSQMMTGSYSRNAASRQTISGQAAVAPFFNQWNYGFNLNWELDFWGRFRRAIESDTANLNASVEDYDDVLVTLLGDVAANYVQMRTLEGRIGFAKANVQLQQETLKITEARYRGGNTSELDPLQARSTLEQTQAQIPELEISLRQTITQLCILLGMPPEELQSKLGPAPIPNAPVEVAVGIPADLLRRRPDVRRAERQAAAQSARIGVAEADFYPAISINGTVGYSAEKFPDLFRSSALTGSVGPSFQWNLLNYGRILNNVRLQDARLQELVATYQQTVLSANKEVEDGLVTFLRAQQRTRYQAASVNDAEKAVTIVLAQYKAGTIDFTRVTQLEQALVQQQDVLTQAQGEIVTGLIQVYKALGGGWQIRLTGCEITALPPQSESIPEGVPSPFMGNLPAPDSEPATIPPNPIQ